MNKKKIVAIILLLVMTITSLPFGLVTKSFAFSKEVSTVAELQTAVNEGEEGDVFTLSDGFTYDNVTITISNVNITVDGGNKIWNNGSITVNGAGTGSLTIKNLKMDGTNINSRMLKNTASTGKLVLENIELYNSTNGAIDISTSGTAKTEINSTYIHNNTAGGGPAIWVGGNSNIDINNSTIENNSGTAGGYEAGAIASKNYSGTLNINNTIFRENKNRAANTGIVGGGGGAMSIHYFNGTLNINESIFESNETNIGTASTYDGGAIYILNMKKTATFDVKNSSFLNNIANDDGGAILIQTEGSGNGDIVDKINIENNTFYRNKAYGVDNAMYAGGAIQIFANVGMFGKLHTKAVIKNNSFVNNSVGGISDTDGTADGTVIGLSMVSFFSTMEITLDNNLFVGNSSIDDKGVKDYTADVISSSYYIENDDNEEINIGIESSEALITEALGKYKVEPVNNYSGKIAGVGKEIIKTIPIKPEGVAENKTLTEISGLDQRGYDRFKDFGAVEISWIKYNANGGIFNIGDLNSYDGTVYYEKDTEDNVDTNSIKDKITSYYTVGHISGDTKVVDGETTLKATKEGKEFLGWSTDKDATTADDSHTSGKEVKYADNNLTLYAVWGEPTPDKYKVIFEPEGGKFVDGITTVKEVEVEDGETVIEEKVTKEGYTFEGWYLDKELTIKYDFNTPVTKDITLYAKWEKDTVNPPNPTEPSNPTKPGKPTGTIKEVTLVGGKATLTEKIESQLQDFVQYRLSGKNRYGTSVEVSKAYKNSNTVILASGEKYTDELTATVLASKKDVPILLSEKDVVPEVVMKEIERLGATNIILIGEKGTLSKSIETQLSKYKLERIGGVDRYATAVLIGNEIRTITGNKTETILVDGTNFPDAIAMTSMGVEQGLPILLTKPVALEETTAKAVKDWGLTKITIGGGINSVSSNVEKEAKKYAEVKRISGSDRYETSVLVAEQVYSKPIHVVVASGEVFPDAIVGAPYAAKNKYPIVLSRGNSLPEVVRDYIGGK